MKAKKILHRILSITAAFLLSLFVLFESAFSIKASAETESNYTNVMDDLSRGENFNLDDYPAITDVTDDSVYSLQVIQVAESSDNELFLYVYQPGNAVRDLEATSVNMSITADDTVNYHDYELKLLSTDTVFDKYLVVGVTVPKSVVRFYNIAAIRRLYNSEIDSPTGNDNTIVEVACEVGKKWTATTMDNEVFYSTEEIITERITGKYAGFIRYTNVNLWSNAYAYESFFVAFKTENKIEDLKSVRVYADVYKNIATWNCYAGIKDGQGVKSSKIADDEFLVTKGETGSYKTSLFGKSEEYIWDEIQTPSEFVTQKDLTLSNTSKDEVESMDWVLRFYNAPRVRKDSTFLGFGKETDTYYTVESVSIIELTYIKDGNICIVGVVDNKQSGSKNPSGEVTPEWFENFQKIFGIVVLIALVIAAVIFLGVYAPPVLKIIWFVIKLPFRAISWLFKSIGKLFRGKK